MQHPCRALEALGELKAQQRSLVAESSVGPQALKGGEVPHRVIVGVCTAIRDGAMG